jgi:hypothetical protein
MKGDKPGVRAGEELVSGCARKLILTTMREKISRGNERAGAINEPGY